MKNDELLKNLFKQNLKKLREEKNLSIEELSLILGIPSRTLKSYELGERTPSAILLVALYEKLNLNLNWFASGKGNMFNPIEKERLNEMISQKETLSDRDFKLVNVILKFFDENS